MNNQQILELYHSVAELEARHSDAVARMMSACVDMRGKDAVKALDEALEIEKQQAEANAKLREGLKK